MGGARPPLARSDWLGLSMRVGAAGRAPSPGSEARLQRVREGERRAAVRAVCARGGGGSGSRFGSRGASGERARLARLRLSACVSVRRGQSGGSFGAASGARTRKWRPGGWACGPGVSRCVPLSPPPCECVSVCSSPAAAAAVSRSPFVGCMGERVWGFRAPAPRAHSGGFGSALPGPRSDWDYLGLICFQVAAREPRGGRGPPPAFPGICQAGLFSFCSCDAFCEPVMCGNRHFFKKSLLSLVDINPAALERLP